MNKETEMLTIQTIIEFLNQNIKVKVLKSQCKKWFKYFNSGEQPYPCVCSARNKECIELQLYYELEKAQDIYNKQSYFKEAIEEFNSMEKNNDYAILSWIRKHKTMGSKLFFTPTISILCVPEKNEKLTIKLNPDEFSTVIQFQDIFNTVYYSEEFQTNINQ